MDSAVTEIRPSLVVNTASYRPWPEVAGPERRPGARQQPRGRGETGDGPGFRRGGGVQLPVGSFVVAVIRTFTAGVVAWMMSASRRAADRVRLPRGSLSYGPAGWSARCARCGRAGSGEQLAVFAGELGDLAEVLPARPPRAILTVAAPRAFLRRHGPPVAGLAMLCRTATRKMPVPPANDISAGSCGSGTSVATSSRNRPQGGSRRPPGSGSAIRLHVSM